MEIVDKTIALLIDSDNVSKKYFTILIDELNKYGTVVQKRIYGDFTKPKANGWGNALLEFAIEPIQQYACVSGKNSTDSAMIIDAMDILYKGKINCICLATSDSDFTKLATRFRSDNIVVIGAGTKIAPHSFRAACDRYILMDVLLDENEITITDKESDNKKSDKSISVKAEIPSASDESALTPVKNLVILAKAIIEDNGEADGTMLFANFMSQLYKKDNAFNPKNYGESSRLIPFFKNLKIDNKSQFIIVEEKHAERIGIKI